ncbi:sulfotransferase family protein [Spongiibacter tropicus]|uniref:sulfotransferase family protein n=1 Tax=Spongiibacter tropicus TaxID=454602 RepID=UPI003A9A5C66
MIKPIFIISLPRSGSTLLQRIFATSSDVATCSEPWILLGDIEFVDGSVDLYSEYDMKLCRIGRSNFIAGVDEEKRKCLLRKYYSEYYSLYDGAKDKNFFLDKTPRYHLISDEIESVFGADAVIYLIRHPVSVINSIIDSFGRGKWVVPRYNIDIHRGLESLSRKTNNKNFFRYEDLVVDAEGCVKKICEIWGVDFSGIDLDRVGNISLPGLGDKTGIKKYSGINSGSRRDWSLVTKTNFRKWWVRRYVSKIGERKFSNLGYDYCETIESLRFHYKFNVFDEVIDVAWHLYGVFSAWIDLRIIKRKFSRYIKYKYAGSLR